MTPERARDMYERAGELGRAALANQDGAPTPSEVDDLLALIAGTGYASQCVELVEAWIEGRFGIVGEYTAQRRAEVRP